MKFFASTGPVNIRNAMIETIVKDIEESTLNTVASDFSADGLYFSAYNQSAVYFINNDDIHVDDDGSEDINSANSDAEKYVSVYTPRGVALFDSGALSGVSFEILHKPEVLFAAPSALVGLGMMHEL